MNTHEDYNRKYYWYEHFVNENFVTFKNVHKFISGRVWLFEKYPCVDQSVPKLSKTNVFWHFEKINSLLWLEISRNEKKNRKTVKEEKNWKEKNYSFFNLQKIPGSRTLEQIAVSLSKGKIF